MLNAEYQGEMKQSEENELKVCWWRCHKEAPTGISLNVGVNLAGPVT